VMPEKRLVGIMLTMMTIKKIPPENSPICE